MAGRQLVIFKVNQENFGIDINQVNIIVEPMEIFKVPNTPDYVEGLINLRGKVYTIFNLRKKFGLPTKEFDENTKIILVKLNTLIVGLIVDEVNEIVTFEDQEMEPAPPSISTGWNRRFISGVAKKSEKLVMILDMESLLSIEEEGNLHTSVK
jgi:purine-binding chemotaxis protein CheW